MNKSDLAALEGIIQEENAAGQTVPLDSLVGPCPLCGTINSDDWPIEVAEEIVQGGCQECWEKQSDAAWWKMVVAIDTLRANTPIQGERSDTLE